jgi:hypothetical protein
MPEYIQKVRTLVSYARPHESPVHGVISLAVSAPFHEGSETILERLNSVERVIPFESPDGSRVTLVNRTDLLWVAPRPGTDPKLVGPGTFLITRQEDVQVRLDGGETLEGVLQMELPEGFNRVTDYLNGPEDFFPLATPDGPYLVNKLRVREVKLFRASPKPEAA